MATRTTLIDSTAREGGMEPPPLGASPEVVEELIKIVRSARDQEKADASPTSVSVGIDTESFARQIVHIAWRTYLEFLLGQAMIDHGRTTEISFPFITKAETIRSAGTGQPTVKFSASRSYCKASRMVRDRRKWLLQIKKFHGGWPSAADVQAGVRASSFSPELAAIVEKDLADIASLALRR